MQHIPLRAHRAFALTAALICGGAQAVVTVSGDVAVGPTPQPLGPGNTVLPTHAAWVGARWAGTTGIGSLTVDAGSFLQLAKLSFGAGGGTASGTGLITGAGTRVELVGDGASQDQVQRLGVGDWGLGSLTVSAGAALDTAGNQAPCLQMQHYCDSFVGGAAGDTATLNVDGTGSLVRTGQSLFVAAPGLAVPALDGYAYGVAGGTTRGTVNVARGGSLVTDRAQVAPSHWSTAATGMERNIGEVNVIGPGSRWVVTGGNVVNQSTGAVSAGAAGILTANHRNALAMINVTQGGLIEVQGPNTAFNYINLSEGGGRTDALVDGAGSKIAFTGPNGVLQVGRRLGSARLDVTNGGVVEGLYFMAVGRDGSFGEMVVDSASSRVSVTQFAAQALQGPNRSPAVHVGNNGTGSLTVSGGALVEVAGAGQAAGNGPNVLLGVGSGSAGTLSIAGSGSTVRVSSASVLPAGGPGEAWGAYVGVGQQGAGTLNITGGGKLIVDSTVVSTDADRRSTVVNIGGNNDTTGGARGIALVRGTGSEISVNGAERFVAVGRGPSSFGQLTLADGGKLSTTNLNVGRSGGVGVLEMDGGRIEQTGQYSTPAGAASGTGLAIGSDGGTGIVRMTNGSTVSMVNMGSSGIGLSLGGSLTLPGGDGSLTMSGGSSISIVAAPERATVSVGRQGSGVLRMSGASSIDIGDGRFFVGRETGSDGTVIATGGSVIRAGWVGIGRNRLADGSTVDGGTGTMVLNGATLDVAGDVVIGTNGFLGGTAGSINATGTVTNYGIFAPGSSPGTFTINADYVAGAGNRLILDVQARSDGGFDTDLVLFGDGSALDLDELGVEFRFLAGTSPDAFAASGGFDIDTFLARQTAGGPLTQLDHALLADTTFSARAEDYVFTSFSFTAEGGAVFHAVPIPEPATWLSMLCGTAALWGRRATATRRGVARSPARATSQHA